MQIALNSTTRLFDMRAVVKLVTLAGLLLAGIVGCGEEPDVVLYCSVDETFAREVIDSFESRSCLNVQLVPDSEASKTTGLVNRIRLEKDDPRADVFWSSELFNTILLAREDHFEAYKPPNALDIPDRYRDREGRWTAFGLRARVLAFDRAETDPADVPFTWQGLADPEVAPMVAFANPLFGTTRGHVAAMFALWGPEQGRQFLTDLRDNGAQMVDGNSTAVRMVAQGDAQIAATDTDDVEVVNRTGPTLAMRYPDMGDGGTLLIPNSVAILRGTKNPEAARQLVNFLVSTDVEEMLAASASKNIPVRAAVRAKVKMRLPPETEVSYDAIADAMPEAVEAVREILIR